MSRYIEAEALKQKKVYSVERHEYVVPVAEIDWQPTAPVAPIADTVREMLKKAKEYADVCGQVDVSLLIHAAEEILKRR